MTQDHSALLAQLDALKSADVGAVFAELIRAGLQALIEAEATEKIGAGRYQRCADRGTHRNGHRAKTVSTTAGDIEVQIPKLRVGSFFPSLLERRRRIPRIAGGTSGDLRHGRGKRRVESASMSLSGAAVLVPLHRADGGEDLLAGVGESHRVSILSSADQ
jgi:hypothetical protein